MIRNRDRGELSRGSENGREMQTENKALLSITPEEALRKRCRRLLRRLVRGIGETANIRDHIPYVLIVQLLTSNGHDL